MKYFLALLLLPASAGAAGTPYYVTVVRNGACPGGGHGCLEESYKALEKMVQVADAQGVKLTLLFSDAYAQFVSASPARQAAVQAWKNSGHEAGAWHREGDQALLAGAPLPALAGLAGNIKTACTGGKDPAVRAFEVCPAGTAGGVNRYARAAAGGGRALRSCAPEGRNGVEAAKKDFHSMRAGVYSASFPGEPAAFGAYYAWLSFLKEADQFGGLSRTASQALAGKLLPDKDTAPRGGSDGAEVKTALPVQRVASRPEATAIPRLAPRPSPFSVVERLFFGPKGGRAGGAGRGYYPGGRQPAKLPATGPAVCGDGVCSYAERGGVLPCPKDCRR